MGLLETSACLCCTLQCMAQRMRSVHLLAQPEHGHGLHRSPRPLAMQLLVGHTPVVTQQLPWQSLQLQSGPWSPPAPFTLRVARSYLALLPSAALLRASELGRSAPGISQHAISAGTCAAACR